MYKIFNYIREKCEKHTSEITVIYGLDADLIMLSMNHIPVCPNIYLFRETPTFIQSISKSLEPNATYILDIPGLAKTIVNLMNNGREVSEDKQKNAVHDYIFLCFFLGNDFLPHFPALNIRTGGIDKLLDAYRTTIGTTDKILTDGKNIYWANVRVIIQLLATNEEQYIIEEHALRNKKEKYTLQDTTPDDKFRKFDMTPSYNRECEQYINPNDPYWKRRYYKTLFNIHSDKSGKQTQAIVMNYLRGLEWNMKYYSSDCPSWHWKYNYHYPPLLEDLIKYMPLFNTTYFKETTYNPVSEMVQLCYVLPHNALHLLPHHIHTNILNKYAHNYKDNLEFTWAYCRYFWESHITFPEIDITELEIFIDHLGPRKLSIS